MIPVLYPHNLEGYRYLGKGKLPQILSCTVHEELNGDWSMIMKYPINGEHVDEIMGNSIAAYVPHQEYFYNGNFNTEIFDVYKRSDGIDGVVTFEAYHYSRRLKNQIVVAGSVSNVLWVLRDSYPTPTYYPQGEVGYDLDGARYNNGTVEVSGSVALSQPKSVLSAFLGAEESLVHDVGGDICFTTYFSTGQVLPRICVSWLARRGADRGASVRFGVNMLDLDREKDISGAYNAVVPFWDDGNGNITYASGYVVTPAEPVTPVIAVPLDCSSWFEEKPTSAQLVTAARTHLSDQTPWNGEETIRVDLLNGDYTLPNSPPILIGDTVHVYWGEADIATDLRVVAYDYDVLSERYISMELGTPQTEYVAVTGDTAAKQSRQAPAGIDYRIYSSVDEIGLAAGSATVAGVWSALPIHSMLICSGRTNMFASDETPASGYGTVEMVKTTSDTKGWILFHGERSTHGDYRMFLNSSGVPDGTWVQIPGNVQAGTVTKTFAQALTADSSSLSHDGHTAILNLSFRYSTGFTAEAWTNVYSVTPKPRKAAQFSSSFGGQTFTIEVTTGGVVRIFAHSTAYKYFVRCVISYFI